MQTEIKELQKSLPEKEAKLVYMAGILHDWSTWFKTTSKSTIYNCNCLQQNTLIFFAGFPITKASSTSKSNSCEKEIKLKCTWNYTELII